MEPNDDDYKGQTPLRGVVLCCTSISTDDRTKLADVATQMGAVHKLDLTSDVTHLIVGCITTAKYQYVAKDRPDIRVLGPAWLPAVRDAWMEGGDVDVAALEEEYRLATFFGLDICVTGFNDPVQRDYIATTVKGQGATYHGDLTKQVTHLIAAEPQGAKYTHAKQWGSIKVVSEKWFRDSLTRRMALDETLYDPTLPIDQQGKGAFTTLPRVRTSLGKRARDSNVGAAESELGKKRLRRTASTRLESQSQDMWSELSARDAGNAPKESDRWRDDPKSDSAPTFIDITLTGGTATTAAEPTPMQTLQAPQGLFAGCYILLHGFNDQRKRMLYRFLEPNGARLRDTPAELENASSDPFFAGRFLLVPHIDGPSTRPDVPAATVATEWWVERCIHSKKLLDPAMDVLSRAFEGLKIDGFSGVSVSTTGFDGVDLRQVAEAVKMLGANYQESITPSTSVIICGSNSIKKEKAFYANRHRIPVVSVEWLWACMNDEKLVSYDPFKIALPREAADATGSSPASGNLPRRASNDTTSKSKDEPLPKRLSTTRKKHATPSLSLQANRSEPATLVPRPPPIIHDDDDDPPPIEAANPPPLPTAPPSRRQSRPLQEISPNCSPRKGSQTVVDEQKPTVLTSDTISIDKPASRTSPPEKAVSGKLSDDPPPALESENSVRSALPQPREDLTADLAELLKRQTAARPNSRGMGTAPPPKRKNRPLGRAVSNVSNRSMSASAPTENVSQTASQAEDAAADGFTANVSKSEPAPPSTQIGYETPEAEMHRAQMSKRMGVSMEERSGLRRVASVGVVKDSPIGADAGVGGRVKRRQGPR